MSSLTTEKVAFKLKGGMVTLTTIQLLGPHLGLFESQLTHKVAQAPQFFKHAPVVIDLAALTKAGLSIDFQQLAACLRQLSFVPVGIRNHAPMQKQAALDAGFALIHDTTPVQASEKECHTMNKPQLATEQTKHDSGSVGTLTRVITEPVRSGQQVYAKGGDLIVQASVAQGAEVLADGHIHVYGTLRGRALAGVEGDTQARIYCTSLEAELVSIAGQYQLSETLQNHSWKQSTCIALIDSRLQIASL